MSKKEYEIKFSDDGKRAELREIEDDYDWDYDPGKVTWREELGDSMRCASRTKKIVLTLLFNIYGALYRFGSNNFFAIFYGIIIYILHLAWIGLLPVILFGDIKLSFTAIELLLLIFPWAIDIISILAKDDIIFIGMKKYKNPYEGRRPH